MISEPKFFFSYSRYHKEARTPVSKLSVHKEALPEFSYCSRESGKCCFMVEAVWCLMGVDWGKRGRL